MDSGKLGSPPLMQLLTMLKPLYWFAAHLHVKFEAVVPHRDRNDEKSLHAQHHHQQKSNQSSNTNDDDTKKTSFLALDKVLPGR